MLRNWRVWVLSILLIGPIVAYVGMGALWLAQHDGPFGFRGELLAYATTAWVLSGVVFSVLASRWTKAKQSLLPPLDWDQPKTFNERDRTAWNLVQEAAGKGDALPMDALSKFDTYIDTGRSLARRLARHYQPHSNDPVEHVPVVEMLTALQLAAEDLCALCREVPGGDMVTPAHWKRAIQAAGYLQRANEIYTFLLPLFQPAAGVMRLGTQKLMVQPAWKDMQQNLMRWFFRAYINRFGTHLIELYSGRLAIGADRYRRLSRRGSIAAMSEDHTGPVIIGIAGALGAGKSTLLNDLDGARERNLGRVRARLKSAGLDTALAEQLRSARLVEINGYSIHPNKEKARDRATRRHALRETEQVDLLVMVVDASREDITPEVRFLEQLEEWFASHPGRDPIPVLTVVTSIDRPEFPGGWSPPYNWESGERPRERWLRTKLQLLRSGLSPMVADVIPVALRSDGSYGVEEHLLPELAALLHRAERASMLRHLDRFANRSKVGRLMSQVGRQGKRLWGNVRAGRETPTGAR